MYFLLPSHLLDKVFPFLESLQNTELNLCFSLKDHTVQMSLEILLIVQWCLQTRMLRNTVLIAVVLLPIDDGTGQVNMFESTNVLHEMTLRGKNNFILLSASIRNRPI